MLTVRELTFNDIESIANYWFNADEAYLKSLGVDIAKMPEREQFTAMLQSQVALPYDQKKGYVLTWEANGQPIGHSNVNPFTFGQDAYMHLHIWDPADRKKGYGVELIRLSLPYYFNNLKIKTLYCEPYALNPAPNRLLQKAGFTFVKEYVTTPGSITFEQPVKLWQLQFNRT